MDIQAMQSMDWLFKKERIYLLAQFWQQVNKPTVKIVKKNEKLEFGRLEHKASRNMFQIGRKHLERATLAEKEVSALKEQLAVANQNQAESKMAAVTGSEELNRSAIEVELSAKDKEISQLVEDIQRLQSSIGKLQENSNNQIARLEEELEHKRQHICRLEARLDAQRDYDDLKKQLSILRSIELPPSGESGNKSLEALLLERSKAIQQAETAAALKAPPCSTPSDIQGAGDVVPPDPGVPLLFPAPPPPPPPPQAPPLQNVETFGSFLGEEIVANWRRSLERTILSQGSAPAGKAEGRSLLAPSPINATPPPTHNPDNPDENIGKQTKPILSEETSDREHDPAVTSSSAYSRSTSSPVVASSDNVHVNGSGATPCKSPPTEPDLLCNNNSPHISNNNNSNNHNNNNNGSSGHTNSSSSNNNNNTNNNNNNNNISNSSHNNNNNNNNIHNSSMAGNLVNGLCGLNVGLNNNVLSSSTPLHFNDVMKSPFRFDDRSPFRFNDDAGVMVGRFGESLIPKGDPMEARLQEMLRYNMDKYSTQNLDTLHIARKVRELLSIHNVGQRLFAKYVLGLSQGTVSELLSKPKPWDKLTEKGRDSYRKMHAWACDENAVLLLKSLIPKKGKDTGIPAVFGRGDVGDMTEERIAHILNEASQLMKPQSQEDSHSNEDSRSPNHGQSLSPLGRDSSQNRRMKKYENDDIPQEQVVRIYQEELAKIMGRRFEDTMRAGEQAFPSLLFPHFFGTGSGSGGGGSTEDIRMALDAYHRELAKLNAHCPNVASPNIPGLLALQQQALNQQAAAVMTGQQNGMAQDLSLPKVERKSDVKLPNGESAIEAECKKETAGGPAVDSVAEALRHAGSAFSLVRPKTEPGMSAGSSASSPLGNSILPPEDFSPSAAVSPLQRMASITNALISQPAPTHHHSPSQRPLKAVLPPITQQQFDQFNNLNTEEIVRKVKEQLSQFSISQRLFGESVLGLSQGSVSDLLARPKPWHMLTQKGREPFIRMKMFLEDDNAVHKLVASQYKIAPEKLMRTGGYGINPPGSAISKPLPPSSAKLPAIPSSMEMKPSDMASSMGPLNYLHPPQQVPPPPPPPLHMTPPSHHMPTNPSMEQLKKTHSSPVSMPQCTTPQQNPISVSGMRNMNQAVTPSVYEMAALTHDLDTQNITTKIKEALLANNIGQKIFGEAVLGLSQGSVSELLSKPKPWHMLSIKGREPFIRMQLWLADTNNIDRLQAIKSERRELNKRRRGSGQQDNSSDTSSNDTTEFYHSSASSPPSAAKKQRVLFSEEQKEALRLAFALDPYPSLATIEFLANELTLASRTITNWFHNHRMRLKQQSPHCNDSLQPNRETPGSGFDPVQFRVLLSQRLGFGPLPLPFPSPYFPPNPELAALMSRGMMPMREQDAGLDLTVKHEAASDDEDNDSRIYSEDSDAGVPELPQIPEPRTNRRKPAAPQWVNPDWQEEPEVIINGVCVMQTDDYNDRGREGETVRVEPTPVMEEEEEEEEEARDSTQGSPAPLSSDVQPKQEPPTEEERKPSDEDVQLNIKEEKWDSEF